MPIDGNALLKGSVVKSATKSDPVIGLLENLRVCSNVILKDLFHLSSTIFNIAYYRKGAKPYRASPPVSPALKYGVLDGGIL